MVDTITTQKVRPFILLILGSSSREQENGGGTMGYYPARKSISGPAVPHDTASHADAVSLEFSSDTYVEGSVFLEEMYERDIYVAMEPRAKYAITAKIRSIRKGEPQIVVPESSFAEF